MIDCKKSLCYNPQLLTTRGGAEAARRAHNPKVRGSSPLPATKKTIAFRAMVFYLTQ
jgi:hypothetical protein